MTAFEYVFGMMSVITSLGLAHLVSGFVTLASREGPVRFSLVHACWTWTALATSVANWGALWPLRGVAAWPNWLVLTSLAMAIGQYAFCALVTPRAEGDAPLDLSVFHERQRRRYGGAALILIVFAIAQNLLLAPGNAYAAWLHDTIMSLLMAVCVLLAIFVPARWAQHIAAIGLAAQATYFLVGATSILT